MKALDRLRALEFGEKVPDHELTEPTKGASVSFVSTGEPLSPNISRTATAHYRWLILEANGERREVCTLPPTTRAELAPCYPGARLLPLPDAAAEATRILNQHAHERETMET